MQNTFPMKIDFLLYLLEGSCCTAVFYLLYRLLLHRETCFVFNRVFILLTIGLSLVLPLVELPSPATAQIALPVALSEYSSQLPATAQQATSDWASLALGLYWTGVGLMLLRVAVQLWRLRELTQHRPVEVYPGYRLIRTHGKFPTFSFYRWLFWNNETRLTDQEQQLLQHELAHIQQWHSVDVLLVELVKAVFWFNPFLYLYQNSLRAVHEYLADQQAVGKSDLSSYSHLMARQFLQHFNLLLVQPFSQFLLNNRIMMLRLSRSTRPAIWKMALSAIIVAVSTLLYACNNLDLIESDNESLARMPIIERIPFRMPTKTSNHFIIELSKTLRYPNSARADGIQGTVYASFIIHTGGSISDIVIDRGVREDLNQEVLRALREAAVQATWSTPLDGKSVETRTSFPVAFALNDSTGYPNSGVLVVGYKPKSTQ